MDKGWSETVYGVATLVVLGLIFSYATWGGALTDIGGYTVRADYGRIDGLVVGSKVRLTGIDIGDVASVRFLPDDDRAEVFMRIRSGVEIPDDSGALIVSDSLFSSKFIQVDPGGSTDFMANGDEFSFVQDSVDVIGIFQKLVENAEQRLGIDPTKTQ